MSTAPNPLKTRLLAVAEAAIDELLTKQPPAATATLEEIETLACAAAQKVEQAVAQALVDTSAREPVARPICPTCGAKMVHKGPRTRRLETQAGEVAVTRTYYHCPTCPTGVFPPR
jgi:hypothetical protein